MRLSRLIPSNLPREYRTPATPGQSGPVTQFISLLIMGVFGGTLIANIVMAPTKRNVEVLAGIIFLGFVLIAHPFRALQFVVCLIPFPAYTSVGSTTTLLIYAVGGLLLVKSRQLRLPSPFVNRSVDLAIMGWFLMALLSLYQMPSAHYKEALMHLSGFASVILLFYTTVQLTDTQEKLVKLIQTAQIIALILAVIALLQFFFPAKQFLPAFFRFSEKVASLEEIRRGEVRAFATFSGYELFAEYMAICTVFHFLLIRRARSLTAKLFWIAGVCLIIMALFTTGTRAGLLILGGGFAYMLVVARRSVPRATLFKILFVALAIFYLSLAFIDPLVSHMFERFSTFGTQDSSVQTRTSVMSEALSGIADSPFLGHGVFIPGGTWRGPVKTNIHSLYVHLAYTIGLPGLMAFVWFMATLWRLTWRGMNNLAIPVAYRELMMGLNVVLVMFAVDQLKIEYTRTVMTMHIAWFHFGLMLSAARLIQTKPETLR